MCQIEYAYLCNIYVHIEIAKTTLSKLNKYSHSQGVIVRNKKIVAIEDKNGTEGMLKKCKIRPF